MALAFLFSSLHQMYGSRISVADNPVHSLMAITIDHSLRDGSSEEARQVTNWLRDLHIKSRSIPLAWRAQRDQMIDPKDLKNVETVARALRYRTLGTQCLNLGISSLFTAHHEDDQYETLLMRLLSGHKYRGLQGIRPANPIPECYDMHQVSNSGLLDDQLAKEPFLRFRPTNRIIRSLRDQFIFDRDEEALRSGPLSRDLRKSVQDHFPGYIQREVNPYIPYLSPLPCEEGGITIYRPLLQFDKDRLIATCEANRVPWVEDATNQDPTLTTRNAVRHLIRHHKLPEALSKESIIALGARAKRRVELEDAEATRLITREAVIEDFDPNVGTLLAQLPTFPRHQLPQRRLYAKARKAAWLPYQRRVAAEVIRKMVDFVTPDNHLPAPSNLDNAINWLFPELAPTRAYRTAKGFSVAGVFFDPVVSQSSTKWLLSRAPYSSREIQPYVHSEGVTRRRADAHCHPHEGSQGNTTWRMWKAWQLWDGRYWIRMSSNFGSAPFTIRPYDPQFGKAFRTALPPKQRERFDRLLKYYAPGKIRTTLPAIYSCDQSSWSARLTPEKPILLALPTLRMHIPGSERWVAYEVRYKHVDVSLLGHRRNGDGVPLLRCRMSPSPSRLRRRNRLRKSRARGPRPWSMTHTL